VRSDELALLAELQGAVEALLRGIEEVHPAAKVL
jgi:hypothetical protein